MRDETLPNWSEDPIEAKKYLLDVCKLNETSAYGFYFEDGTGFCGTVDLFIPYMIRRFKVNPESSFEIDSTLSDKASIKSGELYMPGEEGEVWDPNKRDDRF